MKALLLLSVAIALSLPQPLYAAVTETGEQKLWHKVTITMDGPSTTETATSNPFFNYRMDVTFTNGSKTYVVPGYFAADGDAAESSATGGNKWRAHFSPDATGTWNYTISFHTGTDVAVNGGGTAVSPYDGTTGQLTIAASDKTGRDFRAPANGRLIVVSGQRYLQFAGSGKSFLRVGPDSPENFLGCGDFDNTYDYLGATLAEWSVSTSHLNDWQTGDPTWQGGKGKGLIGALNYLAAEKMNTFSFLTYNAAGGDGKDVWPYLDHLDRTRFDCSKLDQWEILFSHADKVGLHIHFKLQETENDQAMDGGALGRERKLYYRELIARFGHHLGVSWNLGEETTQTTQQQKDMAQFFYDNDPYGHHVDLHTYPGQQSTMYTPLLGTASKLTGVSIQTGYANVHKETLKWITDSANAGKQWIVACDEIGSPDIGVPHDAYTGTPSQATIRANFLWGCLMAGGQGVESYFGYSLPSSDLDGRDFRTRNVWWDYCRFAQEFFVTHLPFKEMVNANGLIGNTTNNNDKYCLAKAGDVYCVYMKAGANVTLNLTGQPGTYDVRWYNPRAGGSLIVPASTQTVTGGGSVLLGNPPSSTTLDWVVLVKKSSSAVAEIIVDNADPSPAVTKVGTWTTSTTVPGYYGANYLTDTNSGKGTKTVRLTPAIPTTATYDVYMRWPAASGRSPSVPVTITHANGTAATTVNQQLNTATWMLIGTHTFNAGTAGNVLVSNTGTTGDVIVDAVRFVATGPLSRSGWIVSASHKNTDAGKAIDGLANTRWTTGIVQVPSPVQWYRVNLGSQMSFSKIVLDTTGSPDDSPASYIVSGSNDGTNWTSITSGAGTAAVTTITFPPQTYQHIKMEQVGSKSGKWWSIHELNIYP